MRGARGKTWGKAWGQTWGKTPVVGGGTPMARGKTGGNTGGEPALLRWRAGVVAVISIGMLGSGKGAAEYYLSREAGCELDYYTGLGERPGRWVGPAAQALGLDGELDAAGKRALRSLLAGRHPDGSVLVAPVLRADPHGRLPAGPLLAAVTAAASVRELTPAALLAEPALAEAFQALSGPGRHRVPAVLAGRIATAAGLDPAELYPAGPRSVGYTRALAADGGKIDMRRAGIDLTVSAPKSVSVLWAAAGTDDARHVRRAHQAGVTAALEYLQAEASHGLRGHQGDGQRAARIATEGLIAAAFEHRTSRAGDPQIHTHLVIPNLVHGTDGKWTAVDSRTVFRHALTASHVYHAVLRSELTARLGVRWGPVRRGIAEIDGIDRALRRQFSTRRNQITSALARTGRSGPAAAQQACLTTRPAKTRAVTDVVGLRQRWASQLRDLGHDPRQLLRGVLHQTRPPAPVDPAALAGQLLAACGLTDQRAAFDQRAVTQAICQNLPAGATIGLAGLQRLTGQVLADPAVVPLLPGPDEPAFSTASMIGTEQHALAIALGRQHAGVGLVDPARVSTVLSRALPEGAAGAGRALSWPQGLVLRELTRSGRGVEVLVGAAGSGKTVTLAAANICWAGAGRTVIGAALAASAARNLQQATGIPSTSLARLLIDLDRPRQPGEPAALPPGAVIVIDEAGMVGTRELHRLLAHTAAADAKLVLVGDPQQLPEINAGGLFAALAEQLPALSLTDNQRQRELWERQALEQFRAGLTGPALAAYAAHDRIHIAPGADALTGQLAADYLTHQHRTPGPFDVLIVTARRADARRANDAVRDLLRERGVLGQELVLGQGEDSRSVAVGDIVHITRNDYRRDLLNGTRAIVTAHTPGPVGDGPQLTLRTSDQRQVTVPAQWLLDGRLDHAYAITCHKAQGLSVEHTLIYGTAALTRQSGYVALSRGRAGNHLYTTLDPTAPGAQLHCALPDHPSARLDGHVGFVAGLDDPALLEDLDRALTRDQRQRLASRRLANTLQSWPVSVPHPAERNHQGLDRHGWTLQHPGTSRSIADDFGR